MKASFSDVFAPKLFSCMKSYDKGQFVTDLMAGIIVGIVAIPLAIAFGIASGVGPAEGLVTAIIAGFFISFLGGTKVQIGGPTGAFIVIIYGRIFNIRINIISNNICSNCTTSSSSFSACSGSCYYNFINRKSSSITIFFISMYNSVIFSISIRFQKSITK